MDTEASTVDSAEVGSLWINPWRGVVRLWRHHPRWAGVFIVGMFVVFTIFLAVTIATTVPHMWRTCRWPAWAISTCKREFRPAVFGRPMAVHARQQLQLHADRALYWAPLALVPPGVAWVGRYVVALWCTGSSSTPWRRCSAACPARGLGMRTCVALTSSSGCTSCSAI